MVLTDPKPFEPVRVDHERMERIKQLYLLEQKNPFVAKTRKDIPHDFESISPEYLVDTLGQSLPGVEVLSYHLGHSGVCCSLSLWI